MVIRHQPTGHRVGRVRQWPARAVTGVTNLDPGCWATSVCLHSAAGGRYGLVAQRLAARRGIFSVGGTSG